MMRFDLRFIMLAFATVAGGCTEPTPRSFEGTFVLRTIGGVPLPTSTLATSPQLTVADTLIFVDELSEIGSPQLRHRGVFRNPSGADYPGSSVESYRRGGSRMLFPIPLCPPNADCFYPDRTGVVDGDLLTISSTNTVFREQVYVRVK